MTDFTFIDAHAHLCTNRNWKSLDLTAESGVIQQVWLLPLECYAPQFEFDGNNGVIEVAKHYPGFFIPFGYIDYFKGPEQIDCMKEAGFVALKAIRPPKDYNDESYFPIYERAAILNMPILFHVGIISHRTAKDLVQPLPPGPSLPCPATRMR